MRNSKKTKDESTTNVKGTVFMGPSSDKESSVENFSIIQSQNPWDRRTETEYMERVREKAALRVQAMLDQARSNAETIRKTARQWVDKIKEENEAIHEQSKKILLEAEQTKIEAEQIKAQAHEEGLRKGLEQAMQEVEEYKKLLNTTAASILKAIEGQCPIIFENWRLELAELLKTSVEVATGWLLSKEYSSILESLLSSGIQNLEDHKQITIRINKDDQEVMGNVIFSIKETFPDLRSWDIKVDPSLNQGDIVVESISGMIDSRLNLRQEEVKKILQHLKIPESSIEQVSYKHINTTLESTGISTCLEKQSLEPQIQQEEQITSTINVEHTSSENSIEQNSIQEPEEFSFPELEGIELPPDNPEPLQENTNSTLEESKNPNEKTLLHAETTSEESILQPEKMHVNIQGEEQTVIQSDSISSEDSQTSLIEGYEDKEIKTL